MRSGRCASSTAGHATGRPIRCSCSATSRPRSSPRSHSLGRRARPLRARSSPARRPARGPRPTRVVRSPAAGVWVGRVHSTKETPMPMTVGDTLANTTRAAHDVGLAAWLGGAMFGKFAHNPSLVNISSRSERGKVANAAWNGYNAVNAAGLGAAALGWGAARLTEATPANLSGREKALSTAKDGLMAAAVLTGIANGVQGARLAKQAPDGAVPVETGTKPAADTPATAA